MIKVGPVSCTNAVVVSPFLINCTLGAGSGEKLSVRLERKQALGGQNEVTISTLHEVISYKEHVNLKDKFSRFIEYGVGGLKREIDELYRRAFASRGKTPDVCLSVSIIKM